MERCYAFTLALVCAIGLLFKSQLVRPQIVLHEGLFQFIPSYAPLKASGHKPIVRGFIRDASSVVIRNHKIKTIEPNDAIRVYYSSPCGQLPQLVNDNGPRYSTTYMQSSYGFKLSNLLKITCDNHYSGEWLAAVDELSRCRYETGRSKRGMISTARTLSAATNMLRSFFTKGDPKETIDKINRYNITTQIALHNMRDIPYSTNMISIQTDDSRMKTMQHMPVHIYGEYMAHQSIAIKSNQLRRISRTCRETGKLALEPLSELIKDQDILEYDLNQTNITGILVNNKSNYFKIDFEATLIVDQVEEIEAEIADVIQPMIAVGSTVIGAFIGAFLGVIIVVACAFW